MTLKRMVELLEIEKECVGRNCNRDCGNCDLVQDAGELLEMYTEVAGLLRIIVDIEDDLE